jgi:hypothetical protein
MITLASVAISLSVGLVLQYAHGQNMTLGQSIVILNHQLQQQQKALEELLNYCFQHADRPNPIQDLVDKGFLSLNFKGETCISIKQTYNDVLTRIRELQLRIYELNENLTAQTEKRFSGYTECLQNKSTTFEECRSILLAENKE